MRNWNSLAEEITSWISDYAQENNIRSLIVGVSGGVDSAVTSTLSARTGIRTIAVNMPIHQKTQQNVAQEHPQHKPQPVNHNQDCPLQARSILSCLRHAVWHRLPRYWYFLAASSPWITTSKDGRSLIMSIS